MVVIDGGPLRLEAVERVARGRERVRLSPRARARIERARRVLERLIDSGEPVYGVNTGFGGLAQVRIPKDRLIELQYNLLRSHALGAGNPLPAEVVRAALLLRANTLAAGYSGVRVELIEFLLELLNRGITPMVHEQGSVGASGDLAPLSEMALVVIGEGQVEHQGKLLPARTGLRRAGLRPLDLQPKEGLALINGTQLMAGIGVLTLLDAERLSRVADVAGAMSLAALGGDPGVAAHRLLKLRPHPGALESGQALRRLLRGVRSRSGSIQEPYSLRCIPQVHGAVRDGLKWVRRVLELEVGSVTDNPVVFADLDAVRSGGNFHGAPLALVLDLLGMGLAQLATIAERRVFRLLDPTLSGLPPFLAKVPGLDSGFMLAQILAAALVSENKLLAHPASVDSIPTSANQEDHVSMGALAGLKARRIYENTETVLAIELLCGAQALELSFGDEIPSGLRPWFDAIRKVVPSLQGDRLIQPDIDRVKDLIKKGFRIKVD